MTTPPRPSTTAPTIVGTAASADPLATVAADPSATVAAGMAETRATDIAVPGGPRPSAGTGSHLGQAWGDFRFGRMLGKGGMGAVYEGVQLSLDRPVAIKVLPPHLSDDPAFRDRFVVEARSVARISSPHVIQVYGAGVHEGHHFFAMELVEGEDLAQVLKSSGKPPRDQAIAWVLQAARGLAAAGELGIIHRDIKPANLMLTKKGVVKVMDFGLARLAGSGQGLTMTGVVMGTVSYFSPEQGRGERCDCRTDIYALGITFYELLTGSLPFTGTDAASVIYQHIHIDAKAPRALDPQIPEDVQAVCLKCIQKDPERRYQTATDLLRDLEALSAKRPLAMPASELALLRRGQPLASTATTTPAKGLPWGIISVVALTATAGIAGAAFVLRPSATPEATTTVVPPTTTVPAATATTTVTPTPTPPPTPEPVASPSKSKDPAPAQDNAATTAAPSLANASETARLQAFIDGGFYADARAALAAARIQHPQDTTLAGWSGIIDQAEGRALLAKGREALQAGAYDDAAARAREAAALLPNAKEPADLQAETTRRRTVVETALTQAREAIARSAPADAERLLKAALADLPGQPALEALRVAATAAREEAEARARQADERCAVGTGALERKDFEAALPAFDAALAAVPDHGAAIAGRERARALQSAVATAATAFAAALARRDATETARHLAEITDLSPGCTAAREAGQQHAALVQRLAEERRQAEERERHRVGLATTLQGRLQDRSVPVADLEQGLRDFLSEAGQERPERPLLERLLEDRRQLAAVEKGLAALDADLLAGRTASLSERIQDESFRTGLAALAGRKGLVFASRVASFTRDGDQATAQVLIRHAFDIYPERTLTMDLTLTRQANGWVITSARLQEPPR